jgi:hypothetical protein
MASAGVNVARQLRDSARLPLDTYGHMMDEPDHTPSLAVDRRDHAATHRRASAVSELDHIVAMMSASGSNDSLPSNGGRGATMGPPACPRQSPPVPFRRRRRVGLQGFFATWDDWRGQKVS